MQTPKIFIAILVCLIGFTAMPTAALAAAGQFGDDSLERVVSAGYPLPADYVPADLVKAADYGVLTHKPGDLDEMKLRLAQDPGSSSQSANLPSRLRALMVTCEQKTGEISKLGSGYRSFDKQRVVYANHKNDGQAAVPGTSEHQAGLAADIWVGNDWLKDGSATYNCFSREAWKYGFIQSYPAGNTYLAGRYITESWHWRYVGLAAARLMHKYSKKDWPAEFLAKLAYFRWLDSHGMDENWDSLRRLVEQMIRLEEAGDDGARAFAARVSYLAERITLGRTDLGAKLAIDYCRFLAKHSLTEDIVGLRASVALLDQFHTSAEPEDRVAAKKLEKMVSLLRANVLNN